MIGDNLPDFLAMDLAVVQTLDGWCSEAKARALAELVRRETPSCVVEIGVFGGRSLIAQALLLRHNGFGVVWGIDPYTAEAALEGANDPANDDWWGRVNLQRVLRGCADALTRLQLWPWVRLVVAPSHAVAECFPLESIDILHIDGNHSEFTSCRDLDLYLPRVRPGGYVWLDDTDWATMQSAVAWMDRVCGPAVEAVGACRLWRKPRGD